MVDDALCAAPEALRARPDDLFRTGARPASLAHPDAGPARCLACGEPLRSRRREARCCGGRCRAALSRQIRARELALRVRRAEEALRAAADALHDLREFAVALGVPLDPEESKP